MTKENNIQKIFELALDLKCAGNTPAFEVVEGDTENILNITLTDNGVPVALDDNIAVVIFSHGKGTVQQSSDSPSGGVTVKSNTISVRLKPDSFSRGMVNCEIKLYDEKFKLISTIPYFVFDCRASLAGDTVVESDTHYSLFSHMLERNQTFLSTAEKTNTILSTKVDISTFEQVQKRVQPKSLFFQDIELPRSAFVADSTHPFFPYRADIPCPGMTASTDATVYFNIDDPQSALFAPVCSEGTDCVSIFARQIPQEAVSIPRIKAEVIS